MNQFLTDNKNLIRNGIYLLLALIFLGVIFLGSLTLNTLKQYTFIGQDVVAANTITVSGTGKVLAKPNIAVFSFLVTKEAKDVETAQQQVTDRTNKVLVALKALGISDNDIQTIEYHIYPKYTHIRAVCTATKCPSANQIISGYEVSETVQVKVRDLSKINDVVAKLGSLQVSNLNGPNLTIDDDTVVMAQARQKAIADAQQKAQKIASDLGVKLVRVTGFNEPSGGRMFVRPTTTFLGLSNVVKSSPRLPTGQNEITSNIFVTYEIQ